MEWAAKWHGLKDTHRAIPSSSQAGPRRGRLGIDAARAEQAPSLPKDVLTKAPPLTSPHCPPFPSPHRLWLRLWEVVEVRDSSGEQ